MGLNKTKFITRPYRYSKQLNSYQIVLYIETVRRQEVTFCERDIKNK